MGNCIEKVGGYPTKQVDPAPINPHVILNPPTQWSRVDVSRKAYTL